MYIDNKHFDTNSMPEALAGGHFTTSSVRNVSGPKTEGSEPNFYINKLPINHKVAFHASVIRPDALQRVTRLRNRAVCHANWQSRRSLQ